MTKPVNKPKIIFFGSRNSKLSDEMFFALADTDCEIVAVVNSPEGALNSTSGKKSGDGYTDMAAKMGLPDFTPEKPNSPEFVEILRAIPCDAFILAGYAMLVKEGLLSLPRLGLAINFHASLLPDYKGKHPVFWAIRHGEKRSGITAHHLSSKLDEGAIAFQEAVEIGPDDSASAVYDKVIEKSRLVMRELIDSINRNSVPVKSQKNGGSYYSSVKEEDYILDFSLGAKRNKWAVQATPGKCYIQTPHGRLFAHDAQLVSADRTDRNMEDGVIIAMDDESVTVASGGEAVRFGKLSAGGEPKPAGALLQSLGYKISDII